MGLRCIVSVERAGDNHPFALPTGADRSVVERGLLVAQGLAAELHATAVSLSCLGPRRHHA